MWVEQVLPNKSVTRGQMAAFLNRALNLKSAPSAKFADTGGHLFEADIDRLYAAGITTGCAPNKFCPDRLVTRGEMAAFLVRGFKLKTGGSSPFTDIATAFLLPISWRWRNLESRTGVHPQLFARNST